MNNNINSNKENLEDKLYKIDPTDPIFQIDENDPIYQEILENEEKETKEDLKFRSLIKSLNFHKCSDTVEEKVMNTYRKKYWYRIFLYQTKLKLSQYKKELFGIERGLEISLASIVVLFILGGAMYYQYTESQNVAPTNQTAKEQSEINQPQIKDISKTIRGSFITDPHALTSIKKIYLEILGNSESLRNIQNQVTDELSRNNIFVITEKPDTNTEKPDVDAVLRFSFNSTSNEVFVRLVDRKNHIIWSINKNIINKSIGIEIVDILIKDINEAQNK